MPLYVQGGNTTAQYLLAAASPGLVNGVVVTALTDDFFFKLAAAKSFQVKSNGAVVLFDVNDTVGTSMKSTVADGAAAVGFVFDTAVALANATAKIASWKTGGTERAYLDAAGTVFAAAGSLQTDDAVATITRPLTLTHGQSGAAGANNIAVGVLFRVETKTNGTYGDCVAIDGVATDATAATLSSDIVFRNRAAGAALAEIARITSAGDIVPPADASGGLGTAALRWNLVRAVTVASGDVAFEDQACPLCGQGFSVDEDLVLRVHRVEHQVFGGVKTRRPVTFTVPAHRTCVDSSRRAERRAA